MILMTIWLHICLPEVLNHDKYPQSREKIVTNDASIFIID